MNKLKKMHFTAAELEHLRKFVKICFVKYPFFKISKIEKHFKKTDFAGHTVSI